MNKYSKAIAGALASALAVFASLYLPDASITAQEWSYVVGAFLAGMGIVYVSPPNQTKDVDSPTKAEVGKQVLDAIKDLPQSELDKIAAARAKLEVGDFIEMTKEEVDQLLQQGDRSFWAFGPATDGVEIRRFGDVAEWIDERPRPLKLRVVINDD